MSGKRNIAVRIGMAVLIILYVIALTVSLVRTGPTVEDLQGEITALKKQLSESQERGKQNQEKLDAANDKLDRLLKKNQDLQAQVNSQSQLGGGGFSGGGSSGSFTQPSGSSSNPTGNGNSNGGSNNGGGSNSGGSSGGGSSGGGQDAGLVDGTLCTLQLLCL